MSTPANSGMKAIKSLIESDAIKLKFEQILGRNPGAFISSIINLVGRDANLAKCDPTALMQCAAAAAALNLPIDKNLGLSWIIPYKEKKNIEGRWVDVYVPQFQIGYKGFYQLAMRSGVYKRITAAVVYENQFVSWDPFYEEINLKHIKGEGKIVGYFVRLLTINGFEKIEYWPTERVVAHATKFSKTYTPVAKRTDRYKENIWDLNFDSMALKTVLKNTIAKYGVLSVDIQNALTFDEGKILDAEKGQVEFDGEVIPDMPEISKEYTENQANALPASDAVYIAPQQKAEPQQAQHSAPQNTAANEQFDAELELPTEPGF